MCVLQNGGNEKGMCQESRTILVVDDESLICRIAKRTLEKHGFRVLIAADGEESIEIFREHADTIAAVLLDLNLPGINGDRASQEMKRIRSDAKIVFSSGYPEEEVAERYTLDGAADYLHKPYSPDVLFAKMQKVIGE